MEQTIYLISGIPGAGKTTVSRLLAGRFKRGVHIESDALQKLIVTGGLWPQEEPLEEARRQLALRGKHTCLLADSFFEAGFTPVIDDVVIGSRLEEFRTHLRSRPLRFVLLTPRIEVVRDRDAGRDKHVFDIWGHLDDVAREETPRVGLWLDSSDMTAEETVAAILERAGEAEIL
jgi:predicted kinase